MATISTIANSDYAAAYNGYDQQKVGAGLIDPTIYATPGYAKKKIQNLAIGLISDIRYGAFDHDPNPLIVPWAYESQYQTILAFNLHYVPQRIRSAIMRYILESNQNRIKSNQSIIVDYKRISRAIPDVQYITRRYKTVLIGVNETYPLVEIPKVIRGNYYLENHYLELKNKGTKKGRRRR